MKQGLKKRLGGVVSDSPEMIGACMSVAGLGMLAVPVFHGTWLQISAWLLLAAMGIGPNVYGFRKRKSATPAVRTDTSAEDAAVDAFVREMEAEDARAALMHELLAFEYQPGVDRLH